MNDQGKTEGLSNAASWLAVAPDSGYPLHHLPFGVIFTSAGGERVATRLGDNVIDLSSLARAGLLDGVLDEPAATFGAPSMNAFLGQGPAVWRGVRGRLIELFRAPRSPQLTAEVLADALIDIADVELRLPVSPTHFVDFYSSLYHAENAGEIVRPGAPPLPANWRHVPLAYHGRPGNLVVSGTSVRRPHVHLVDEASEPVRRPTRLLDFELEVAFVTGGGNRVGEPITTEQASEHIFGIALLNDWSARDVQRFENPPLGPLMSKSFATTIAAWITPLDALAGQRVDGPVQDPAPLPYLQRYTQWGLDIRLFAALKRDGQTYPLTETNLRHMYWTMDQQLAYLTGGGARVLPGDVYGSGTVSGPTPQSRASLLELTRDGRVPLNFGDSVEVGYLRDGDEVILTGLAGTGDTDQPVLSLGEARGVITAAAALQ
ncbi:fumarylacetoacetate hydrolase family protein [Jatrophihabitans sp. DSM 45814]